MSKQLELTIDLEIRRVTCPGVWLCQDGSVSLILHALNSTYQTHLVPPVFPMIFKSTFQFRKKFPISCAVRNLGCVLKDEDFYCELVQWTSHCVTDEGVILAQYLGAIPDILFVPEVCSSEGIDLLMRRTKDYPGILAPKIEIATRVRLEEISSSGLSIMSSPSKKCKCTASKESHSHKPVCHTSQYHRLKCSPKKTCKSRSQSCGSLRRRTSPCRQFTISDLEDYDTYIGEDKYYSRSLLESRYIDKEHAPYRRFSEYKRPKIYNVGPCTCYICRRYHEIFMPDYS